MSLTLGDDDRRAVDLLMQQRNYKSKNVPRVTNNIAHETPPPPTEAMDPGAVYEPTSQSSVVKRLEVVEQLFSLLDVLPAIDPPPDLVSRTLRFISDASSRSPIERPSAFTPATETRPPA